MANYVNDVMVITQSSTSTPEQPQYEVTVAQSTWAGHDRVYELTTDPVQLILSNIDWRLVDKPGEFSVTVESSATYTPENEECFILLVDGEHGEIKNIRQFKIGEAGASVEVPFERLIIDWTQPAARLFQSGGMAITDYDTLHGITVDTETGEVSL